MNTNTSFKQLEEIKDLEYRLRLYVTLRLSVEANNEDAILWSSKVLSACAVAANQMNELWAKILEDKEIKQSSYYSTYKFIIEEKLNNAKHTLPLEQQEILNLVYPTSKKSFLRHVLCTNWKCQGQLSWEQLTFNTSKEYVS